jgi:hypothetical protein
VGIAVIDPRLVDKAFEISWGHCYPLLSARFSSNDSATDFSHFCRLVGKEADCLAIGVSDLERGESMLREHRVLLSDPNLNTVDIVTAVLGGDARAATLLTAGPSTATSVEADKPSGSAVKGYTTQMLAMVEKEMRSPLFEAHALRIIDIQGDETDPLWQLKICADIMLPKLAGGYCDEHPLIAQAFWTGRKFTKANHRVFPVITAAAVLRDSFVARYLIFGPDAVF